MATDQHGMTGATGDMSGGPGYGIVELRGRIRTADPDDGSPSEDTWWIARDGASPEDVALKVRVDGQTYTLAPSPGSSGDVVGPASAVDGHLAVFDGTDGKTIKDGGAVPSGGATILFDSTLGADATTIDTGAAGIAGGYSVLEIWLIIRTDEAVVNSTGQLTFNADSGGNYDRQFITAINATLSGAAAVAQTTGWTMNVAGASCAAGVCAIAHITIPGYAQTTFFKVGEAKNGFADTTAANSRVASRILTYRSTAAITRATLAIATGGAKYLAGSRMLIYGR